MKFLIIICAVSIVFHVTLFAQSSAFKYQGSLTDGGSAANGSFQMQFKLFDALAAGNQVGSTLTDIPVTATSGVFSVSLDFGTSALNGANRWIEIAVRRNAGESYVTLSPREQISSAPYAVRTLSAATADTALDSQKLGGVNANQFVQTNDARLSDARIPLPNSPNYIQNQNAAPQALSNFNVSGSGTAASLNVNGPFTFGNIAAPAVAPAGQGRLYYDTATNRLRVSENGGAFVNLVGSGISGTGTVNRVPLWSAGTTIGDSLIAQVNSNIGISTLTPQSRLHTVGTSWFQGDTTPLPAAAGKGIAVGFSGENGYIFGFDYSAFSPKNLILNGPGGNVGIGTVTPGSGLEVRGGGLNAQQRITDSASGNSLVLQGGAGGNMKVTGFNYGSGTAQPLYLSTDGANTYLNSGGGSVGIGTTSPTHTLDVNGFFRAFNVAGGNVVSETNGGTNAWAKFWVKQPLQNWSIGSSNNFNGNQLYFTNENTGNIHMAIMPNGNVGIGSTNPPSKLWVDGNVGQRDSSFGMVKAMVEINENGSGQAFIARCYNAVTNSIAGTCGINVGQPAPDTIFHITFPFRVTDRFFSLTTQNDTDSGSTIGMRGFLQSDISGQTLIVSYFSPLNTSPNRSFFLIVY